MNKQSIAEVRQLGFSPANPAGWLTDASLSDTGREARNAYQAFCNYLDGLGLKSFQIARAKYFLQGQNYWLQPYGYAIPPHTINVCVNNICNLHCRHCDFGQGEEQTFYHQYNVVDKNKRMDLPLSLCKSIVDQAKWFKPIIRASFREPMLYKPLYEFIDYTKQAGLPFWLLTNGTRLKGNADELVRLGVDSVRLSLDGPQDVHDDIRGVKGCYSRMIEGLKELIEAKKSRGSDMQIGFYFTLSGDNYSSLFETMEQLDHEGVLEHVFFNFQWLLFTTNEMARQHNQTHAAICGSEIQESTVQNIDVSDIDIPLLVAQRREIQAKYPAEKGYRIHFRPSFEEQDLLRYRDTEDFPVPDPRCRVLWYNMNINPVGDVKCFHHCLLEPVGNVYGTSLMDIWNGQALREQRAKLQQYGAYRGCTRCWGIYSLLEDNKRKN